METEPQPDPIVRITEMPTQELLEEYLLGMHGIRTVYFDLELGKFIRHGENSEV